MLYFPRFDNPNFAIVGNRCPPALAVGATCSISIQFTPTTIGNIKAQSNIAHDGNPAEQSFPLLGVGSGAMFTIVGSSNSTHSSVVFSPTLIGASSGLASFYPITTVTLQVLLVLYR